MPSRWSPLRDVPEQIRLRDSTARFCVVAAGRRSGKTERAKRRLVKCSAFPSLVGANYVAGAPTRDQAKRIWWEDLVELAQSIPGTKRGFFIDNIGYSDLTIDFVGGSRLMVVGFDKPQRIEGIPIDGAAVDEYQECRPETWNQSLRPALSTIGRPGWAWFTGRPKGRGHFYDLWTRAKTTQDWAAFHWTSAEILPPEEIDAARRDLDPLTFSQEYEAKWVTFDGLAYYQWSPADHLRKLDYDPSKPLVFCFDFNVDPGVAVIVQEQDLRPVGGGDPLQTTCVLAEVHIPRNSNTPAVCRKLAQDWGHHRGPVLYYGDATGGSRKTSQVDGTDWDLVRQYLKPAFADLSNRVGRSNPPERDRVNAVNARLKSASGVVRIAVDPIKAPNVVRDFEGVTLLQGGSGEIDKKRNPSLTHLSDALGYYITERHPILGAGTRVQ